MISTLLSVLLGLSVSFGFTSGLGLEIQSLLLHPLYEYLIYSLLCIGLYGSVYGIDLADGRANRQTIFQVVTIGVLFKIGIIGFLCFLIGLPGLVFAPIVAQIDPIAVSALLDKNLHRLSPQGGTILRAWSSFDDPMTVLFAVYIGLPFLLGTDVIIQDYFFYLLLNFIFAASAFGLYSILPKNALIFILLSCFGIAVAFKLTLGIALIGFFLRPSNIFGIEITTLGHWAFLLSLFVLGMLLISGLQLTGIYLGIMAILAQILVTFFIFWNKKHSKKDTFYLAFAQYNGITAIILAVFFERYYPGTVGIIAVAIFTINVLHFFTNKMLDRKFQIKPALE